MSKVAALVVLFRIPIVRQFDLRFVVPGRGQEDQGKTALLAVIAPEFGEAQLVAVEVEGLVDVGDAHHCMEIFHCLAPLPC